MRIIPSSTRDQVITARAPSMLSNRWSCRLPKVLALVLLMMLSAWYLNQVVVDNICVKNLPVEILSVETLVHV